MDQVSADSHVCNTYNFCSAITSHPQVIAYQLHKDQRSRNSNLVSQCQSDSHLPRLTLLLRAKYRRSAPNFRPLRCDLCTDQGFQSWFFIRKILKKNRIEQTYNYRFQWWNRHYLSISVLVHVVAIGVQLALR